MGAVQRTKRAVVDRARAMSAEPQDEWARSFRAEVLAAHPPFVEAVLADAKVAARRRGERAETSGAAGAAFQVLRLIVVTDSFFAQVCYRAKASLQAKHVPIVPRFFHRLAIMTGQICIGDPVVLAPGVYIPHGQVVADARTTVAPGATLSPFVTLGRVAGKTGGPKVGALATVGTGAKLVGPVTIGRGAVIGANSVVTKDVPAGAVAAGVPARILRHAEPVG